MPPVRESPHRRQKRAGSHESPSGVNATSRATNRRAANEYACLSGLTESARRITPGRVSTSRLPSADQATAAPGRRGGASRSRPVPRCGAGEGRGRPSDPVQTRAPEFPEREAAAPRPVEHNLRAAGTTEATNREPSGDQERPAAYCPAGRAATAGQRGKLARQPPVTASSREPSGENTSGRRTTRAGHGFRQDAQAGSHPDAQGRGPGSPGRSLQNATSLPSGPDRNARRAALATQPPVHVRRQRKDLRRIGAPAITCEDDLRAPVAQRASAALSSVRKPVTGSNVTLQLTPGSPACGGPRPRAPPGRARGSAIVDLAVSWIAVSSTLVAS